MRKSRYFGILMIVFAFVGLVLWFIWYGNQYTETRYDLSEISDGIYVMYHQTESIIPAQNYDVITFRSNDRLMTFKGKVLMIANANKPYADVRKYNFVNSDEIYLFLPSENMILWQENIRIR